MVYFVGTIACYPYDELIHYGVKGMKWGVRRTLEELGYRTSHRDIQIYRSVGAAAKNYKVKDHDTGDECEFVPGTKIQNVETFAGRGTKTVYRRAAWYADKYGGKPEDWQHTKGVGWLRTSDGDRKAEVHWSQHPEKGKIDFKVKRWLD